MESVPSSMLKSACLATRNRSRVLVIRPNSDFNGVYAESAGTRRNHLTSHSRHTTVDACCGLESASVVEHQ